MDISSLRNISSGVIKNAAETYSSGTAVRENSDFGSLFAKAVDNLNTTNAYVRCGERRTEMGTGRVGKYT